MRRSTKKTIRFTALLLLLCVMFTCMPAVSANSHADHTLTAETETDSILDDVAVKRYVNAAAFDSRQHVKRLPEKERLDTFVYNNIDGTQSTYYMSENVKYIDQRGEVVDKDTSLLKTKTGYTVRQNEYDLNIPFDAAEGVQIGFSGVKVSISPRGYEGKTVGAESGSAVVYKNCFGDGADLKYTPLLSGVKEDIIIYDHTGSEYSFVIKTNGAYICSDKNGYYISGNKNAARADGVMFIGDVIVYDAAGRPGTGKLTVEPVVDGKEYIAAISVDESFLTDEKTVYPVTIDPTITISDTANGSNSIEDTIVFSGYPNNNFYNYIFLTAGYTDDAHKIGRVAVRTPGLLNDETYASLTAGKIVTAVFGCFDSSGHGTQPVNLYRITSPWTETTATWNNLGSSYSTATDDWSADMPNALPTEFDITTLVKGWKSGAYNGSYGFMLVNSNESTQSLKKAPFSSEYPDDSKRPYIVITYQSNYGSIEGEYYLNNRYTGKYIHKNGSTAANGQSGLLSSLQNTVKWELRHHGNDVYSVRHKGSNYYLNVSGGSVRLTYYTHDSIANTAKWEMTNASGGGKLMRNVATNQYLYSSGTSLLLSSTLGTVGTSTYNSRAWRLANTAYYGNAATNIKRELSAETYINNIEGSYNTSVYVNVNSYYNELWDSPSDFTYSFSEYGIASYSGGKMTLHQYGGTKVEALHKVTNRVKTFYIIVGFSTTISSTPLAQYIIDGLNQPYDVWPASSESRYYSYSTPDRADALRHIYDKALLTMIGGWIVQNPDAASMLDHFLDNNGTLYDVGMKEMISEWDTASNFRERDMNYVMKAVEASASYSYKTFRTISLLGCTVSEGTNWGRAVGSYSTSIVCTYRKTSATSFTMQITYELHDVYDWDRTITSMGNLPVSPRDMWELHHGGIAKNYEVYGKNTFTLSWTSGQTFSQGAVMSNET